jgi:hypothetical protein
MRIITSRRRRLIALAVLVATALSVGLVASVAWSGASDSSDPTPGSEAPPPTETYPGTPGGVTDAGPNPWEINSPEWALRFLEDYCPGSPPLSREMVDEINAALRACVLGRVVISGGHVPRQ